MTSGAPWSVKGIDPKAREIAKDLARRSGMTLGEWLNQMILDDGAPPAPSSQPKTVRPVEPTTPLALSAAFESSTRPTAAPRQDLDRLFEGLDQLAAERWVGGVRLRPGQPHWTLDDGLQPRWRG